MPYPSIDAVIGHMGGTNPSMEDMPGEEHSAESLEHMHGLIGAIHARDAHSALTWDKKLSDCLQREQDEREAAEEADES